MFFITLLSLSEDLDIDNFIDVVILRGRQQHVLSASANAVCYVMDKMSLICNQFCWKKLWYRFLIKTYDLVVEPV